MKFLLLLPLIASLACGQPAPAPASAPAPRDGEANIYKFSAHGLEGGTINFDDYAGKKILIVNTASKCGYTPQYEGLEELSKKYADRLVIVGFPSDNFGHQEPGSNEEIAGFCQKNYGVTFPMAQKSDVKGEQQNSIYKWLTSKAENGFQDSEVKWNFQKYLLNEKGELIGVFMSDVKPMSEELQNEILK